MNIKHYEMKYDLNKICELNTLNLLATRLFYLQIIKIIKKGP